jgi:hypothetical protein
VRELATPEVIEQHRTDQSGETAQYKGELHLVMNYLRMMPITGRTYVYAEVPYRVYRIGRLSERGATATILDEGPFGTEREAAHRVFLMRLAQIGVELTDGSTGGTGEDVTN